MNRLALLAALGFVLAVAIGSCGPSKPSYWGSLAQGVGQTAGKRP